MSDKPKRPKVEEGEFNYNSNSFLGGFNPKKKSKGLQVDGMANGLTPEQAKKLNPQSADPIKKIAPEKKEVQGVDSKEIVDDIREQTSELKKNEKDRKNKIQKSTRSGY